VKVEFCQFKWWMLYCNKVVLTGKTILVFILKLLNLAEIIVLLSYCWSLSSVKRFTLFTVEGFTFFRFHLGMPYRKWAMLLFMSPWSYHTWVRSFYHLNTHEYFSVRQLLLGMSIASLCNPLGSNPARQRSLNYFRFFFESTTSYWTYFRLKTTTHEVLINDKFPPEQTTLASQSETCLVRSEAWTY